MNFIGVDVHKSILTVANISENLDIEFIKNMSIQELINYLKSRQIAIVSVDAPYKLNLGLMNKEEYRTILNPKLKGHYNKKVSEYELSRRGINPFSTPGCIDEIKGWKDWMNTGFNLYSQLEELGYRELSSNTARENRLEFIEVFPHACFTVMLGYIPSKKDSDNGLRERLNILKTAGFNNIEEFLYSCGKHEKTDRLDALVAAYTAYLTYNHNAIAVGDTQEGKIVLPISNLKDSYKRIRKVELPKYTSSIVLKNEPNECSSLYEYINVDSVLWLKYFKPLHSSPPIKNIIQENLNSKIKTNITNEQGASIIVELVPLRNRLDGLKVSIEDKSRLNAFWGTHGDKRKYLISVI